MGATPRPALVDPWRRPPAPPRVPASVASGVRWAGALALGIAGVVARDLSDGLDRRALLVVALGIGWLALPALRRPGRSAAAGRAAAAAALVVLSPPGAHRGSAVALAGLWVAHAAIIDGRPWPGWPARRRPVAWAAIPVSVLAGVAWYRHASVVVVLALLVVALAVVEAHHRFPAAMDRVDAGAAKVARGIGVGVTGAILFVVAVPVLYLPGLVGRMIERRRRRRGGSTWRVRDASEEAERRLAGRPFAPTPPGDRRRRHAFGLALLVLAALALANVDRIRPEHRVRERLGAPSSTTVASGPSTSASTTEPFSNQTEVVFSDLPAFAGVSFADALQAEQQDFANHLLPDPVTGIASGTFRGRFTNVIDGVRATRSPDCGGCPTATLWLTGGSTAFGLGQRDDHTIASDLVEEAQRDGIALTVRNLAVPGWTLWQERQALAQRLAAGDPAPDLVVSFGGYNDVAGGFTSLAVYGDHPGDHNVLDSATVEAYVRDGLGPADAGGIEAASTIVARRYREVEQQIRRLASDAGAASAFFFQPDALASSTQFAPVADVIKGLPPEQADVLDRMLERTSQRLRPDVTDLRHLYDDEPASLYADWAHTNERGAALAAAAIYDAIRARVHQAAGA